ncbi:TonB-dependent receptor [Aliiglaciecola sp. 3_MG-2023]|uniref:TonB-dependent receptor domain-containing protein n=1 Tax=Aliiglaciecola sp. 3_MG-2023 TaxID=3062644 RepID=UPI0026E2CED3|nr:TonB-dependent receptor [Aliiglaciecola sp. 3_MG-2023]MDO6693647.1 TonB-dependent receptor [Aliiglaciecola sp. 3_MG-2023]
MKNAIKPRLPLRHALVFSSMLSISAMSVETNNLDNSIMFNIPEQSLNAALLAFSEQSGIQVTVQSDYLKGLTSEGISGEQTSISALDHLLENTGLIYTIIGKDTIAISKSQRENTLEKKPQSNQKSKALENKLPLSAVAITKNNEKEPKVEQIQVTGSRIGRLGSTTPTPVTSIDAATLALSGDVRIADILNELPAIRATQTTGNVNTTGDAQEAGTNFLNLRGLGIDRTLVLINGRRHVGSRSGSAAVDMNTIPSAIIKRVEVITGGASAIYGADAVSGVINIITKDDMEGLQFNAQTGISSEGDGEQFNLSLTGGSNFADDRGNIFFNATFDRSLSARSSERDWASTETRFGPNPDNTGSNDGIADQILFANTGFIGTPAGGQVVGPNGETFDSYGGPFTFDDAGNLVSQDMGYLVQPWLSQGGDFVDMSDYDLLAVPVERTIVAAGMTYDINDDVRLFADGKFAKTTSDTNGQPTFNLGSDASASGIPGAFILAQNPYVPDELRTILSAENVDGFYVGRTNVDQGGRQSHSDRDTTQLVFGFEGVLTDNIDFTVHYQYGETNNTTEFINERINANFLQQIDVVLDESGTAVCRDQSNGCVPLNILGPNAATEEALVFSQVDFVTEGKLAQQVLHASVNGYAGIELPGGEVAFAAGVEYREETSATEEGYLRNSGALFATAAIADTKGEFDVNEVFAEVSLPLFTDVTLIQSLTIDAAVRYADYSTIGAATTWKVGADWAINETIRLRTTLSEAVRAPNIGELYAAVEQSNQFLADPCDADYLASGSANRAANCEALGLTADYQSNSEAFTKAVFSGGNEDLQEEKADTFTFGVVFTPEAIDNLSITVDYWDIEIKDAISSFSAQATINGCVDASSLNNPLCSVVTRDASGNIATVSNQLINIASFEASGVDVEANYLYSFADSDLCFSLIGTYLNKLDFYAQAGEAPDQEAGELGDPELQFNFRVTYQWDALTLTAEERYFSDMEYDLAEAAETRSPNTTGTIWYTDLQARYALGDSLDVYAGINNVFDKHPPALALVPETRSFGDDAIIYDQIGRYFYTGLSYQF